MTRAMKDKAEILSAIWFAASITATGWSCGACLVLGLVWLGLSLWPLSDGGAR